MEIVPDLTKSNLSKNQVEYIQKKQHEYKLTDEELKNCRYPYPYDTEYLILEFDDIGVSNKVLCLGVTSNG